MAETPCFLNYCFPFQAVRELIIPGHFIRSSCLQSIPLNNGDRLKFNINLIYHQRFPGTMHLLLHIHLHQPTDIPFIPILTIAPMFRGEMYLHYPDCMDTRIVKPTEPAHWDLTICRPGPYGWKSSLEELTYYQLAGEFVCLLHWEQPPSVLSHLPYDPEPDWSRLPDDMISAVLRELQLHERVQARLVCRTWARVLDSDSRTWINITFLDSFDPNVDDQGNEYYDDYYKTRQQNQVQCSKLVQALDFLAFRKAPIRALKLTLTNPHTFFASLDFSQIKLELRSLTVRCGQYAGWDQSETSALVKFAKRQPKLEQVHLEVDMSLPPSLLSTLPQLRILNITFCGPEKLHSFHEQESDLGNLVGLRIWLCDSEYYLFFDPANLADAISATVERLAPNLRRVEDVKQMSRNQWHCSMVNCQMCPPYTVLVWGAAELSPAEADSLLEQNEFLYNLA